MLSHTHISGGSRPHQLIHDHHKLRGGLLSRRGIFTALKQYTTWHTNQLSVLKYTKNNGWILFLSSLDVRSSISAGQWVRENGVEGGVCVNPYTSTQQQQKKNSSKNQLETTPLGWWKQAGATRLQATGEEPPAHCDIETHTLRWVFRMPRNVVHEAVCRTTWNWWSCPKISILRKWTVKPNQMTASFML